MVIYDLNGCRKKITRIRNYELPKETYTGFYKNFDLV